MRKLLLLASLLLMSLGPLVGGTNSRLILFDQKTYQTEVEPALRIYLTVGDPGPLRTQIRKAAHGIRTGQIRPRWDSPDLAFFEAALALLAGQPGYEEHLVLHDGAHVFSRTEAIRNMVKESLAQALVNTLCLVRENHQIFAFDIWDSEIRDELYRRSAWIKAQFWGTSPTVDYPFEFSTYGGSGPLPVWFTHELNRALSPIRRVSGSREARRELALVKRMVHLACTNPNFRLVMEY